MTGQILLIEDDDAVRASLAQTIELAGMTPLAMSSYVQARRSIRANFPGVILTDMQMPHQDGFDVLRAAQGTDPELPVIMLTAHGGVPSALRAMKEGAWDYLEKPCSTDRLIEVCTRALAHRAVVLKSRRVERALLRNDPAAVNFPGSSKVSDGLRTALRCVAATRQHVHIWGDEGTGKRQAAYVINQLSSDPTAFLRVNFQAPDVLASTQTIPEGATDLSAKRLHEAGHGQLQDLVNLVNANPDLRLITSSVHGLADLKGTPLTDDVGLMEKIVEIRLPTLEERKTDLPEIFTALLHQIIHSMDGDMPDVPEAIMAQILSRDWPGNLLELRSFAMSFVLGDGGGADTHSPTLAERLDAFEKLILIQTLKRTGGRVVEAAALLGIPRNTLYDRMARYDLSAREFRSK